jgi:hypothetical protein
MSSKEDEFEAIARVFQQSWSGMGLRGHITRLPTHDQCRRLVDLNPEGAAKLAQHWHDYYVDAKCDAMHVGLRLGSRKDLDLARDTADYCEIVRDGLVRAGAASPRQTTCHHGKVL